MSLRRVETETFRLRPHNLRVAMETRRVEKTCLKSLMGFSYNELIL